MNENTANLHIFTLREALGMTQADLARETGLTQSSISRIERGGRGISLTNMRRIATALHYSVGELLGETPYQPAKRRAGRPS